jgi:hypothetical protein
LSYLLTDTTVIIEDLGDESELAMSLSWLDLHDETDVEVFPGGPEGFF